jgi:tetratricopeptide (TPR) repeat protein
MENREKATAKAVRPASAAESASLAMRARILGLLGEAHVKRKEFEPALEKLREKLPIHEALEDHDASAATHLQMGHVFRLMDCSPRAGEQYRIALALGRQHGLKGKVSESLLNLGMMFYFQKETEQAQEYFQNAVSEVRESGPLPLLGRTLMHLGNLFRKEGTNKKADSCYAEAIKAFKAMGDEYNLGLALANRALLCFAQDDEEGGRALVKEAFERLFFAGAPSEIHLFKATLAAIYKVHILG